VRAHTKKAREPATPPRASPSASPKHLSDFRQAHPTHNTQTVKIYYRLASSDHRLPRAQPRRTQNGFSLARRSGLVGLRTPRASVLCVSFGVCPFFARLLTPNKTTGKPELESAFPSSKRDETRGILHFCWPEGKAALENVSAMGHSENFSFVLTESDGSKRFGYCRRFLRTTPPECFCVVTRLPSILLFQDLLNHVERRRLLSHEACSQFLAACVEAPCPAPGESLSIRCPSLKGDGGFEEHHLKRPEVNEVLLDFVTFFPLFSCVSVKNVVHLFANALLERRIILVAENLATLSSCVMAGICVLSCCERVSERVSE
jgi:hypothetical protein